MMHPIDLFPESQQRFRASVQLAALEQHLTDQQIYAIARELGHTWRTRQLPPPVTVRSMVYRGLHADRSIAAVVADLVASGVCSDPTLTDSAWCQARSTLPIALMVELRRRSADALRDRFGNDHLAFGRAVFLGDGSTLSMPDEPALVEAFGYADGKHGPSRFPVARITFLTLAGVEAVWDYRMDDYRCDENTQLRDMWHTLPANAIVILDRKFSSFYNLAKLPQRGVDVITRLHQRRDPQRLIAQGTRIGPNEWIVPMRTSRQLRRKYNDPSLPEVIHVRLIRTAHHKGGKRHTVWLVTTLLDPDRYPRREVAALYRRRWGIQTRIASVKVTLELTVLRSKTVPNVHAEVEATLLGHNLVWTLIHEAADRADVPAEKISFAAALKVVLAFSHILGYVDGPQRQALYATMLDCIARWQNHHPPGRSEPRAVKRDRRRYPFLKEPREQARQKCLT